MFSICGIPHRIQFGENVINYAQLVAGMSYRSINSNHKGSKISNILAWLKAQHSLVRMNKIR